MLAVLIGLAIWATPQGGVVESLDPSITNPTPIAIEDCMKAALDFNTANKDKAQIQVCMPVAPPPTTPDAGTSGSS